MPTKSCGSCSKHEVFLSGQVAQLREEKAKLERENAELRSACELALKVGTSYPNDSRAHIDSYTENALRKALVAKGGKG